MKLDGSQVRSITLYLKGLHTLISDEVNNISDDMREVLIMEIEFVNKAIIDKKITLKKQRIRVTYPTNGTNPTVKLVDSYEECQKITGIESLILRGILEEKKILELNNTKIELVEKWRKPNGSSVDIKNQAS